EHIGENVVLRIVVDDLHGPLLVLGHGAEDGSESHLLLRMFRWYSCSRCGHTSVLRTLYAAAIGRVKSPARFRRTRNRRLRRSAAKGKAVTTNHAPELNQSQTPAFVRPPARALAVIESLDARSPAMTLSDVARRTGLSRGTARRLLLTLVELGYCGFD